MGPKPVAASCLLVGLLLLAPTSGAAAPVGSVDTSRVALLGDATAEGHLATLAVDPYGRHGPALDSMHLEAGRLHIHALETENAVLATGISIATAPTREDHQNHTDVSAEAVRLGAYAYAFVAPLDGQAVPRVDIASPGLSVQAAPQEPVEEIQFAYAGYGPRHARAPGGHSLVSAAETVVTVTGSFYISLYEVDLRLGDDQDAPVEWSGTRHEPVVPETGVLVQESVSRQLLLTAHDARLTAHIADSDRTLLHAWLEHASAPAGAQFRDAHGTLSTTSGVRAFSGAPVQVEGPVAMAFGASQGGRFQVDLRVPDDTRAGSGAFTLPDGGRVPLWALAAAAAGLVALLAATLHRQRGERMLDAMERDLNRGDYRRAARRGARLPRRVRSSDEAVVMHTVALLRSGRGAEALERLDSAPRFQERRGATKEYLYAHAHVLCGHEDEALECLSRCITVSPPMAAEARRNPRLAPVLERLERRSRDSAPSYT